MHAIRPWLLVGRYADTCDRPRLLAAGVGAMLQLAEAVPQPGIASLHLAVDDGAPIPPAALAEAEGLGVLAAVRAVRARHPGAQPHSRLLGSLCAHRGEVASIEELVRAWTGSHEPDASRGPEAGRAPVSPPDVG